MTVQNEWPDYCPDPDVTLDVSNGLLTVVSGSKVLNLSQLGSGFTASVWKNGASAADLAVATDGTLSLANGVQVASTDRVELRLKYVSPVSDPWLTRLTWERWLVIDGYSGSVRYRFATGYGNVGMPVPSLEIDFGWSSQKLRVGVKPTSADGASQALVIATSLPNGTRTTTNVNLSSATQQTHDSSFTSGDVQTEALMELSLASGSGSPRQEDHAVLAFTSVADVPSWDGSAVRLYQTKSGGAGKLSQ